MPTEKPKFNVTEITHATPEQAKQAEAKAAAEMLNGNGFCSLPVPDLSLELAIEERRNHG